MQWLENGFFDHLDKFANSLGYEHFPIVLNLAMIPWESPEERDRFILTITGNEVQGGDSTNFNAGMVN
jgi:hypothetical protein